MVTPDNPYNHDKSCSHILQPWLMEEGRGPGGGGDGESKHALGEGHPDTLTSKAHFAAKYSNHS